MPAASADAASGPAVAVGAGSGRHLRELADRRGDERRRIGAEADLAAEHGRVGRDAVDVGERVDERQRIGAAHEVAAGERHPHVAAGGECRHLTVDRLPRAGE